jgi:hypothetical protein
LNTIASAAAGLPAPRVALVRSLTVENVVAGRQAWLSACDTHDAVVAVWVLQVDQVDRS